MYSIHNFHDDKFKPQTTLLTHIQRSLEFQELLSPLFPIPTTTTPTISLSSFITKKKRDSYITKAKSAKNIFSKNP